MKLHDDSMKLCVLINEIDGDILFGNNGAHLYYIPIKEYKKQLLKNNVNLDEDMCAYVCYVYLRKNTQHSKLCEEVISKSSYYSMAYTRDILDSRFLLGEENIKNSMYREEYENYFNIKL